MNEQQIQFWNDEAGRRWVDWQEHLDEQLEPVGVVTMDRLGVPAGSSVIDVGCGCGATTFDLARRVGERGSVTGVDISEPMLEHARKRLASEKLSNVHFVHGDAQRAELAESDLVFSRFGVMFFEHPVEAFANLRRALGADGRIGFACWRALDLNPFMYVAARAAGEHVEMPPRPPPGQPGPFAFADGSARTLLAEAGYQKIEIEPVDVELRITRPLEEILEFLLHIGPAAAAIRASDPGKIEPIRDTLRERVKPWTTPEGVAMTAAVWVVTASK